MSGKITVKRGGVLAERRPSWQHVRPADQEWPGIDKAQLEMLESIRNLLEVIERAQDRTRIALERIDRRLAKVEKLR